jgi:hypothetical protein
MHKKVWSENLNGRDHSEDLGVDEDKIRMDLREIGCRLKIGFIWLRIRTDDGHF